MIKSTLGIPYKVIDQSSSNSKDTLTTLLNEAKEKSTPVALVVRKNTFSTYFSSTNKKYQKGTLLREQIIEEIVNNSGIMPIITTTGMASRELYEIRDKKKSSHEKDFLTVGGMGHASQIASGIALTKPNKKVICIDGDGALLMHTGALAISGRINNLIHIVINNGVHDSVGGQPTMGKSLCLSEIANNFKYASSNTVATLEDLRKIFQKALKSKNNTFIEVLSAPGSRKDLGRPLTTLEENKNYLFSQIFMISRFSFKDFVNEENNKKPLFTPGPASIK